MGAVAGIAGAVLNGTAQSGQKDNLGQSNASSQTTAISNAQNSTPDIKSAEVKDVPDNTETSVPKTESSGSSINWAELAKAAKGLLDEHTSSGSPSPITVNEISQASPLANFR